MIVEQSVECSERKKGRSTSMLLKVVDEIEDSESKDLRLTVLWQKI
jgi:hypothetical protein